MSVNIDTSYINQFSANIHMILQQQGSKLKGLFMEEMAKGEKHFFERIGIFTASEITGRLEEVNLQDPDHSRRMASIKMYDAATYLSDIDKVKMLIDPSSEYVKTLANAHGKNYDQLLISSLLGTAATGKDGSGSTAFDTTNQQIAHGSAGLTLAKLNQALRILESNEVDLDAQDVYLLLNARGLEDLMSETGFTSHDYQMVKTLSGKELPSYRGIKIVKTQRIPDSTAGSVYRAILTTADAMKVAIAKDMEIKINERPDKKDIPLQVYTKMGFGAVRMEEARVVDILFQ